MAFTEIYKRLMRDKALIDEMSLIHGPCLRLYIYDTKDVWLFSDGFKLEVSLSHD